jgi:DNA modification methylase
MQIKILQGDCIESLKKLKDESVNTCITSPPYWGLRDYNGEEKQLGLEDTPEEFVDNLVKVFKEVKRVLRDDGTVWLNLGDTYSSHKDCKSTPQSLAKGMQSEVAHVIEKGKSVSRNTKKLKAAGLKNKDLIGIPWRVALALQQDGWYLRQDIIWHKPNPMPESVKDRCTKAHEYIFLLSKQAKYYFDNEAIKEDAVRAGKIPKGKKYSSELADDKIGGKHTRETLNEKPVAPKRNKRSVWTVTTKPFKGAHFATFPIDLIEPCVSAGCPEKICVDCGEPYKRVMQKPKQLEVDRNKRSGLDDRKVGGVLDKYNRENPPIDLGVQKQCDCETNETKAGTVLDPFAGSGTTGIVAANHARNSVLLELNEEYIKIAKKRIKEQAGMFAEVYEDG